MDSISCWVGKAVTCPPRKRERRFYFSADQHFVVKLATREERDLLLEPGAMGVLRNYYERIEEARLDAQLAAESAGVGAGRHSVLPRTCLPQFMGMYTVRVAVGGKQNDKALRSKGSCSETHWIVMTNILACSLRMHAKCADSAPAPAPSPVSALSLGRSTITRARVLSLLKNSVNVKLVVAKDCQDKSVLSPKPIQCAHSLL